LLFSILSMDGQGYYHLSTLFGGDNHDNSTWLKARHQEPDLAATGGKDGWVIDTVRQVNAIQ
jgi:hypothetical protein